VTEHRKIVEEFSKIEEVKRQIKAQKLEKGMVDGELKEAEVAVSVSVFAVYAALSK